MKKIIVLVTSIFMFMNIFLPTSALAKENSLELVIGDVNKDESITISDATIISRYIAKLEILDNDSKIAADFNKDGVITIDDVTAIQKFLANIVTTDGYIYSSQICESLPLNEECKIYFENDTSDRLTYNSERKKGVVLITNKTQYREFTGENSEVYDDKYFETKALVIVISSEYIYEYEDRISSVEVNGKTMNVLLNKAYMGVIDEFGAKTESPMLSNWFMKTEVRKEDVTGIDNIVCGYIME